MINTSNYPLVTMTTRAKDMRDYIDEMQADLIREFGQCPIDAANAAEAALVNVVLRGGGIMRMSAIRALEIIDAAEKDGRTGYFGKNTAFLAYSSFIPVR